MYFRRYGRELTGFKTDDLVKEKLGGCGGGGGLGSHRTTLSRVFFFFALPVVPRGRSREF